MKEYAREMLPSGSVFQVAKQAVHSPQRSINELVFTDADAKGVRFPHHDPLVITAMSGNHLVHRCLIDYGSSVDILHMDVLEEMRISPRSLRATVSPLRGFIGDSIFPEGSIELAMLFREEPKKSIATSNFMVVKGGSSYIIGHPTLVTMKTVTSIYYLCVKFPTPRGVGVFWEN